MKAEHAELLADTLGGRIDIEVMSEYSGRGMYGEQTSGVVVDSMAEFLSALGTYLSNTDCQDEAETIREIGEAIRDLNVDNMGMSIILY
jgi:hypothetical protein